VCRIQDHWLKFMIWLLHNWNHNRIFIWLSYNSFIIMYLMLKTCSQCEWINGAHMPPRPTNLPFFEWRNTMNVEGPEIMSVFWGGFFLQKWDNDGSYDEEQTYFPNKWRWWENNGENLCWFYLELVKQKQTKC
jgi:hypothetical protein